ncbi:hypothetical protein [Gordonia sp. N1V]|uniref:hypothetical protein n=1 Tax=Gordonia sp. N1V TaxID=3034163 RepID=UPI0023E1BADB|nr:hypothetical protein [Gordonia sp. N1V]MDF3280862.1 hypothetical protein [Gordonia sp. N1V]
MSHFTTTVALPGDTAFDDIETALEAALAPFDENTIVPRYVCATKAELIAEERKRIEKFRDGTYAKYLADPEKYIAECQNSAHVRYITGADEDGGFPAKLNWTDEQVYASAVKWEEPENIGPHGEVYSTYNPKSQWDWWTIGGRWGGMWQLKEHDAALVTQTRPSAFGMAEKSLQPYRADVARIEQIVPESMTPTFALVDLGGEWHESAKMGWFGMSSDKKDPDEWNVAYANAITAMPRDTWLVNVDCHI